MTNEELQDLKLEKILEIAKILENDQQYAIDRAQNRQKIGEMKGVYDMSNETQLVRIEKLAGFLRQAEYVLDEIETVKKLKNRSDRSTNAMHSLFFEMKEGLEGLS